ncbi:MAG TPA: hypothetical protein VMU77_02600, partial [Acidimicrobiales bacterium]|nr:hypothetical protein [Acidimicrobiales bacterium]
SWYLDQHGRNTTLWPRFTFQFKAKTAHFDAESYQFVSPNNQVPGNVPRPTATVKDLAGA